MSRLFRSSLTGALVNNKEKVMEGRCMKCQKQVPISNGKQVSSGGTQMIRGSCSKCGTTVCRITGRSGGKRSGRKAKSGRKSGRK